MDNDNKFLGTIGAVIGAVLGIVIWSLFANVKYLVLIGSIAVCFGVFFGYFILGRSFSSKGFIICIAIIAVSVYFATRLNWSIAFQKALSNQGYGELALWHSFKHITKYLGILNKTSSFYMSLLSNYMVTIIVGRRVWKKFVR